MCLFCPLFRCVRSFSFFHLYLFLSFALPPLSLPFNPARESGEAPLAPACGESGRNNRQIQLAEFYSIEVSICVTFHSLRSLMEHKCGMKYTESPQIRRTAWPGEFGTFAGSARWGTVKPVADLEGAEPAPPFGRRTEAATHGHVS